MINLSLNELKLIAKIRNIKDYKNKFENDLIKILSEPKPKTILSRKKVKQIKKDFRELSYRFSTSKINEFRRSLYNTKNQKTISTPKIKETDKNLLELGKSFSCLKKCCDYDDTGHRGIRDTENLFDGNLFDEIDGGYYNPTKTKRAFNGNYIEYESREDNDKNSLPK